MKRDWFAACFARENQIVPRLTLPKGNESQLEFVMNLSSERHKSQTAKLYTFTGIRRSKHTVETAVPLAAGRSYHC